MRIHNAALGGVVFWGVLAFSMTRISVEGRIVEQPDDFKDRWDQIAYNQCTNPRFKSGFMCDFVMAPRPELREQPRPRLYVSPHRSEFGKRILGEDY